MVKQKNLTTWSGTPDISNLMDVFADEKNTATNHINILLDQNTPETQAAITKIQEFMDTIIQQLTPMKKSKEARNLLQDGIFTDILTSTGINDATIHELLKQFIGILNICVEKHRRFRGLDIISSMLSLWKNINQKKAIVTLVINEIKKYLAKKRYPEAYIMAKDLDLVLESLAYSSNIFWDHTYYEVSKILHLANTKKESQKKYMRFETAKKCFAAQQYEKAEKIFNKIIRPVHYMRSDISAKEFLKGLDTTLTPKEKSELPWKLREDGKMVQIPSHYLKRYLEKELSLDKAILSTTAMIYRDGWHLTQTKSYLQEQKWLSTLSSEIKLFSITKIIDNTQGTIDIALRDAYKRNEQLDHTTITQIYDYLKKIESIKKIKALR